MARRLTRTISLSQELDRFVADEVASGHYATASEVIRAGLRILVERQTKGRAVAVEARQG
ncbi:type II toxin-antitoxin system ParD family antitoxin [Sphingomonas sp. PL-96]|uniref:type II toxin-antitoxin system ParD family antitoxin n=1 Tax=Sphingomonas sp. PL-96 TaxID=2887201 RepID=UPI001E60EF98|nr:type II toxin-antitoxin system ParD family antitoxin [Sphingomonas sp. PL-96]MCC2975667.1 type II toxin-antitoxin system ParD family antitoxin [Sphingomonas sp. PL-96]